jgi:hypothetical protein
MPVFHLLITIHLFTYFEILKNWNCLSERVGKIAALLNMQSTNIRNEKFLESSRTSASTQSALFSDKIWNSVPYKPGPTGR